MPAITGVLGDCTIPYDDVVNVVVNIISWSAQITREVHESTSFSNRKNMRLKTGGMMHLVGTCEAHMDDSIIPILTHMQLENAAPLSGFVLQTTGLNTGGTDYSYDFDGIVSNIHMNVLKAAGLSTVTMSFESSGPITRTVPP